MAPSSDLGSVLLTALRELGGLASSSELQARLGVSQPTVSRVLKALLHAGEVRKVGAARSQRYLLPREVPGVGREVPVMRVDAQGLVTPFARIVPLSGGRFWVDEADGLSLLHEGLPWFLTDLRPQGFIGRGFAQAHPELRLSHDPRYWNDDDVLKAMALAGEDQPGNLIVGEASLQRYHAQVGRPVGETSRTDYPRLADLAMQGSLPGSSAGGEQPKFCTRSQGRHVLVKFSPAGASPSDQRGRDLLVCEHLALQTLAEAGLPAAHTEIVEGAGRVFLEVVRFDRSARGRVGMVSLLAYDAEYVGQIDNWAATAERMAARELLTRRDAAHLSLLEAYGVLIANTDHHYGNITLLLDGDDWRLSPTYDMLPMLYAPVHGELLERDFGARPLQPTAATLASYPEALQLAIRFWTAAARDARISAGFRAIAQANRLILERLRAPPLPTMPAS